METEIDGRSLSDSDQKAIWSRHSKESRKTLKLGKKLGLQFIGDEEELEKEFSFGRFLIIEGEWIWEALVASVVNFCAPRDVWNNLLSVKEGSFWILNIAGVYFDIIFSQVSIGCVCRASGSTAGDISESEMPY
ncbi:hypothetical protein V6N11_035071 [Hibiscus sabdariffa]|uniref:Uncharacterized protein n=1 Tax=Hibiscus sabdariffa TaxID=183260 RepID=A0ABR2QZ64_9ROSI